MKWILSASHSEVFMTRSHLFCWVVGLLTTLALASPGISQEPPKGEAVPPNAIEVLPRGPVHEAFAQPMEVQPDPGLLVPKAPPPMIPEQPPAQRPDAENAQWIPGYWAWDAQRQDYIWVSGVYRLPPQGRKYTPGYWSNTPDGWRWITGFWSDSSQQEIPYTPEPPAPLDAGPTTPAPDDDSVYIPGVWVYRDGIASSGVTVIRPLPHRPRLESAPLRLDPERLCLRGWLLGLSAARSRPDVRTGLF